LNYPLVGMAGVALSIFAIWICTRMTLPPPRPKES
jgi:hypothetical protein